MARQLGNGKRVASSEVNIFWSPTALSDLESIRDYIADESPSSSRTTASKITKSVSRLADFPLSGRPGRVTGTRELVVPETPYVAAYMIKNEEVWIAAVLHGKQLWPDSFDE
jgi:toxin ParE1/3/4